MLSQNKAEQRLGAFKVKGWQKARLAELGKLPKKLCTIGRFLLDRDADGKPFRSWDRRSEAWDRARDEMSTLSPKDRERLFTTLFPKLGKLLEAGWRLRQRLPYEADYDRKSFRAPNDPSAYVQTRFSWVLTLTEELKGYDPDVLWVAAWAPYLTGPYGDDEFGVLLAAAIDRGGEEAEQVLTILKESASNEHEVGRMGRHVSRALLCCGREEAWAFMEKLLLAAQRQEGLRQVILETIDEAHPVAFRRMLRLILDHNLVRFSATIRAVDVWLGLHWDSASAPVVKKTLGQLLGYLDDPATATAALKTETGEPLYLALWALGFNDAVAAIAPAAALLKDPAVERRFVAARFLAALGLPAAKRKLMAALDDADLRVALTAYEARPEGDGDRPPEIDLWDAIVRLLGRLPRKKQKLPALVWPWATVDCDHQVVAEGLLEHLRDRPATAMIPYLPHMAGYARHELVERLSRLKKWDTSTRDVMFDLAVDRYEFVREVALRALKRCEVTEQDAVRIEAMLKRKGSELRQGVIGLLKRQKTPQALASADRLLASRNHSQRLAGLDLMRQLVEKKRAADACRERARAYQQKHAHPEEEEQIQLDAILDVRRVVPTLDDALGLMAPDSRSRPVWPQVKEVALCTPAALACLRSLDELIARNRRLPFPMRDEEGEEEALLGNVGVWDFPEPSPRRTIEEDRKRLPLAELWEGWYAGRPKAQRDADGLELLRASVWRSLLPDWKSMQRRFGKDWGDWLARMSNGQSPPKIKHDLVSAVLDWMLRLHPPQGAADFLLDAVETGFALVPDHIRKRVVNLDNWNQADRDWRNSSPVEPFLEEIDSYRHLVPEAFTEAHDLRLWRLMHWRDQPEPGVGRMRPELRELVAGFGAGEANESDVFDQLIGPRDDEDFDDLRRLTAPNSAELARHPALRPIVDQVTEAILQIELKRGEMPTAASAPAGDVMSLYGMDTLFKLLAALGTRPFARRTWGEGRTEVLTHLIQVTLPREADTPEPFAERARESKLVQERLLQLAFVAPQWLRHIEHTLGWQGLREGVWWFLAHMPGGHSGLGGAADEEDDWWDDDDFDDFDDEEGDLPPPEPADPWERLIQERTPLGRDDRNAGAVDTGWFVRAFEPLGRRRWHLLAESAKYGCTDNSHKKAIHLAEVLQGRVKRSELVANIRDRHLKESVRLLGLLPLPEGDKREPELLARYKVLAEYRRYARGLGAMSREDAVRTAEVGLHNLARTAGYPDPLRLEWAMEAAQLADLAAGPVSVTQDGVTVTLAVVEAMPELTVKRGEKPLKAIPPDVRKRPKVAALTERRTELKRSASRVKQSLESAMLRGDSFSGKELKQLFSHPLLRPPLERLVLLGEGIAGFPVAEGQALEDHTGKREPVKPDEPLRIAHAYDLFSGGAWDRWQHNCFERERVQPFKQVFRELYVVTPQELKVSASGRYAGQQVNPSQARALWGSRGWYTRDVVTKTFHDAGIIAEVTFRHHGWTALEVEGLTLESVGFRRRDGHAPVLLPDVPPRLFSEVMRDCDLVVSVAHRGGVDPEASASTVEMRAALLRETCALLGIGNYQIKGQHVLIDGSLGSYSVHLGSAVVHRQPGGSLCIVPVHAQHRGRLFLPFADDDPRTAEVVSKVLLLARDHEIQDLTILDQLR